MFIEYDLDLKQKYMANRKNPIAITERHKLTITMEKICEFMGLVKSDLGIEEKPNFTTKDYTLHQFQCYTGRRLDELKVIPRPSRKKSF
jgi:hypothetical protein